MKRSALLQVEMEREVKTSLWAEVGAAGREDAQVFSETERVSPQETCCLTSRIVSIQYQTELST